MIVIADIAQISGYVIGSYLIGYGASSLFSAVRRSLSTAAR